MKSIITVVILFFGTSIFSQNLTVIDAETGKPIEAVTVFNKSKTTSAVSTEKGKIDISAFLNDEVLIFSHVSYAEYQEKKSVLKANKYRVYLSKNSEQLDEVIVSVFKNREKTNRIAEQIAVVSAKEIEKLSPQTSADLLASVPGIKIQKSQFGGGSPVMRGMESNRVLLVVDGVRMNNAIYRKGHLQNSITVAPNLLERTEVVFGPSSVIYGSDALGGVIHYYTKTPKLSEKGNSVKANAFLRYSSANNEVTNVVSTELSFKKWASFTSVSHSNFGDLRMGKKRSHGFNNWGKTPFYSTNNDTYFKDTPVANFNEHIQKNTGYSQTDVLQKFFVPFSKNTDFKLNLQYSTSSNIPRFDKLTELKGNGSLKFAEWHYGPQERLLVSPQLLINPKKSWMNSGTITLAYQNIKESRIQRKFGSLERSYRNETVDVFSVNGDFTVRLADHRNLGYGIEVAYNDVASNSYGKTLRVKENKIIGFNGDFAVQSRYPDGGSSYLSSAFYVDYRQDINSKSTLNTGVRGTHTMLNASWIDETFIDIPQNNIRLDNQSITATIGYVYKPTKNWQLNSVVSSGFRSPNIDDVGKIREKSGRLTVPNTELGPEYAYNFEIGIQKYFNKRKFRAGLNAYYTILDQNITRVPFHFLGQENVIYDGEEYNTVDGEILTNYNRGRAYITGFTASYEGKILKNWKTSGAITYTKGNTIDSGEREEIPDEPLSSIPPLFGRFDLSYINKKFEGGANLVFNAKKDISDYNLTEGIDNVEQTPIINPDATNDADKYFGTPSWMTIGLYGKYKVNKNITLQAQLSNVFDEHYKEFASGVSAPGRNISVSLQTNF